MQVTFEMYQAAKSMMTCAPAWRCAKEECCFHMAKPIIDAWEAQEHSAALTRAEQRDEVDFYAPHFPPEIAWEWARAMDPDWSAA